MSNKLTTAERHKLVLDFIARFQAQYHFAPTQPEISRATSIPVRTVAFYLLILTYTGRLINRGTRNRPHWEIVDKPEGRV
mgnify:CR=1 FL=1